MFWQVGSSCGYIDMSKVQSVLKTSKDNGFNILTKSGTHTFVSRNIFAFR